VSRSMAALVSALVVGLAAGACGGGGSGTGSGGDRGGSAFVGKKACELLTLDDAKALIGSDAQKAEGPGLGDLERADISLTNCTFHDEDVEHFVGLLLRAGRTDIGARENDTVFEDSRKQEGTEDVTGYGDKAAWSPTMGQLYVYVKGSYLIFNNDKGAGLSKPTASLDEAKKVADLVLPRL
jgi:hypothetical protein